MFSDALPEIHDQEAGLFNEISNYFKLHDQPVLREHVEYDNKILLIIAYILYFDVITDDTLLLCPLLGAVQIPPFFKAADRYLLGSFAINRNINYDYIKYSTYDITEFIQLDEQAKYIKAKHPEFIKVLLLDESLGTGTTLLDIKRIICDYFSDVKLGAVEFRWDKKIVWNNVREWFDIDSIDYITLIAYRHYQLLTNQIVSFKMEVIGVQPYIPYMIYDDINFKFYMSKQHIDDIKMNVMNRIFQKS
jgi:hypothetical protein